MLTTPTSHTHRFHPLSKIVIHTSAHPYCTEVWMTILESGWNLLIFPTPLVLGLFLAAASLLLCSFLKCFFSGLVSVIFLQCIANFTHRTFEIVKKKSRSGEYKNYLIISVIKSVDGACARASPETSTCEVRNQVRLTFD